MTEKPYLSALHGAAAALPHLSGLARLVDLQTDTRVATAAICASGRLLVNPDWFGALTLPDRIFVIAHELMHLALRSHERCRGADARLFNVAHDLIINDMLSKSLHRGVPADGLYRPGASNTSAERIVVELKRREREGLKPLRAVWRTAEPPVGALGEIFRAAGIAAPLSPNIVSDVVDESTERALFPNPQPNPSKRARLKTESERALALEISMQGVRAAFEAMPPPAIGATKPRQGAWDVLASYRIPLWEEALQRWLDDVTPGSRSYHRCSRRQGEPTDLVLAGRRREGWMLNVILDTSGSMMVEDDKGSIPLKRALGSIKDFCMAANVGRVRLVQAGMDVDADDIVDLRDFDQHEIIGGGSSDMCPSMRMLALDPETEAVIVITDGGILYPDEEMPYALMWALTGEAYFVPRYGRVLTLD